MWTPTASRYFFQAGPTDQESDSLFLERYCSAETRMRITANQVNVSDMRHILSRLTALAPHLEHSTPSWTTDLPGPAQLLVCIGRAHLKKTRRGLVPAIAQPRFGICAIAGRIQLWTDNKMGLEAGLNESLYAGFRREHWAPWPGRTGKCLFLPSLTYPLAQGEALWSFIQEIADAVKEPSFSLEAAFDHIRQLSGLPEELQVIYPKLIEDAKVEVEEPTPEGLAAKEGGDLDASKLDDAEVDPLSRSGPLEAAVREKASEFQLEDLQATPASSKLIAGPCYVYALVDPRTQQPFYIGKGIFDRALQHFRGLDPSEGGLVATEMPTNTSNQTIGVTPIQVMDMHAEVEIEVQQAADSAKTQKIRELMSAGIPRDEVARVVARGLSGPAAFALEALLIKGVYGLGQLTNAVAGTNEARFRAAGDWAYQPGFDLPADQQGNLLADDGRDRRGAHYVYVLRDPTNEEIFYVGKGKGARLCNHFKEAQSHAVDSDILRLARIKRLLEQGHRPQGIGRIVARVDSEALAFVVESFYIKFVIGFDRLLNIQPGHVSSLFRSRNDWKKRHGFDLPTEIKGQMRTMMRDTFLGEGLDTLLAEVAESPALQGHLTEIDGPRLMGAGELALLGDIANVSPSVCVRVQVRCSRRFQVCLYPKNVEGRNWMHSNLERFGMRVRRQKDGMLIPLCWSGAANMTSDSDEAAQRALRLTQLAYVLENARSIAELAEFSDLLAGLPACRESPG